MRVFGRGEKRFISKRLRRGLGFRGQPLAPKKEHGRLGVDDSVGGLPALILRGRVRARRDGFDVVFGRLVDLFDDGDARRGQPERRIVGISLRRRKRILRALVVDVAKQLNRSRG